MTPGPDNVMQLAMGGTVILGAIHNMPVNDGALDVLLCAEGLARTHEKAAALDDLLRLVGQNGLVVIAMQVTVPSSSGSDPVAVVDCLGDAASFTREAIAASATAIRRVGVRMEDDATWAGLCLSRRQDFGEETA
jgi:ubiquinone/menaquinone biosynthesis C-methylase UbiE